PYPRAFPTRRSSDLPENTGEMEDRVLPRNVFERLCERVPDLLYYVFDFAFKPNPALSKPPAGFLQQLPVSLPNPQTRVVRNLELRHAFEGLLQALQFIQDLTEPQNSGQFVELLSHFLE